MQPVLSQAVQERQAWACWANNRETWLFTCEVLLPSSHERGAPVLQVNQYGENGELKDADSWMTDPDGKWQRCTE